MGSQAEASSTAAKGFTFAGRLRASAGLPTGTLPTLAKTSEARRLLQIWYLRRRGLQQKPVAPAVNFPCLKQLGRLRRLLKGKALEKKCRTSSLVLSPNSKTSSERNLKTILDLSRTQLDPASLPQVRGKQWASHCHHHQEHEHCYDLRACAAASARIS